MTIADDYLSLVHRIDARLRLPAVKEIHIAPYYADPAKSTKFGAMVLADGTVGLTYTGLGDDLQVLQDPNKYQHLIDQSPLESASLYTMHEGWQKVIGMAAINAASQYLFRRSDYVLPPGGKTMSHLHLKQGDHVGMVGFFPPLVEQLRETGTALTVLELDEQWLQQDEKFEVTLEPEKLKACNRIICTGTVLVNQTIDDLLPYFSNAESIFIVGPTVGCVPDPLFDRGITQLGGCAIEDTGEFIRLWRNQQKWRDSAKRYVLNRGVDYPGCAALLTKPFRKSTP